MLFAQNFEQKLYSQSAKELTHVSMSRPGFVCFMPTKSMKMKPFIIKTPQTIIATKGKLRDNHPPFCGLSSSFKLVQPMQFVQAKLHPCSVDPCLMEFVCGADFDADCHDDDQSKQVQATEGALMIG